MPEDLLDGGAGRHAEEDEAIRRELEGVNHGVAGVGGGAHGHDAGSQGGEKLSAKLARQQRVLEERIEGAEADEDGGAERGVAMLAPVYVVGRHGGGGKGGVLGLDEMRWRWRKCVLWLWLWRLPLSRRKGAMTS